MEPNGSLQQDDGACQMHLQRLSRFGIAIHCSSPHSSSLRCHLQRNISILLIIVAILIFSSSALSQPDARPQNGTLIKDITRNGYGELIIHNNWTMDTVAVLTDGNVKPLIAVYIRSKESFNIERIEDGSYGLYFTVGNLWDGSDKKFRSVLGYYRYNPSLVFATTETETEIEYSIFELDLYEAGASNFIPEHFDFPDLG